MSESTILGIDINRFPRVMPVGAIVIDAFPLGPIPRQMDRIKADLLGQLALAEAPFSDRRVACILAGEHEGYGGHTVERSLTDVEDAFMMALGRLPSKDTKLYAVAVTGEGPMREKHVMPSGTAYDMIAPLLFPGSSIVVIPPNTSGVCRYIPEFMHQAAYAPRPASVFQGRNFLESKLEAIRYTALCIEDCEFVAHLRQAGLEEEIHYYLTGSSSGQGGPSFAIKPGMYGDLDIIAISQKDKAEVEASFESLAEACYGALEKEPKVASVAGSGRLLEGALYSNSDISIDFYVASTLEGAFVRPENLERNFFHRIS
ncbi:MAG TPA: hypothetical protein VLG37_02030 [Candidatus Saccharimonadales bacterium]|nr:hypothetical protein [Candidatus Saccharimonadales bacterium]